VKFRDPHSGIECDLNVNDQLGSINTAMIKRYLDLQPILRPLLKTVKIWAKSLGLNSPSGTDIISFSSYALTLMTIGFFQAGLWF
jgi:DNA polymerase sigma